MTIHTIITLPQHFTIAMAVFASGLIASLVGLLWVLPYWSGHWQRSARLYLLSFVTGMVCWVAWMVLAGQTHSVDALWWQRFATIAEIPYALSVWQAQYAVFRTTAPRWAPAITWGSLGLFAFAWLPVSWWGQHAIPNPDHFWVMTAGMTAMAWIIAILAHLTYGFDFVTFTFGAPRILRHDAFRRRLYPALGILSMLFFGSDHFLAYFYAIPWYSISGFIGFCWVAIVSVEFHLRLQEDQHTLAVDSLTGCQTRSYGLWRLQEALTTLSVGLLYVDADHFKTVNDTYGHAAGDLVLQQIGQTLRRVLRKQSDWVIRVGGDEFIMVVPDVSESEWDTIAAHIQARLGPLTIALPDQPTPLQQTLSVGPAWAPIHSDPETLLSQGDQAMYRAKQAHHAQNASYCGPSPALPKA